ncbi:DUF1996 domain-containing protein [Streptomyces yaizuensis]|uniref:DUF1996 domain-containing protein n=1 Tax=Streptomyces yaizuensis TaxID=2989713 RepID=A0ABQ5NWB3_9ACTN|nr:DUF1996 domain-containing protein [Streptomyces sp. YSPA8]GLF94651.1 DUF1996 domain-containing protein [Streptomyces sp. YSPA8]
MVKRSRPRHIALTPSAPLLVIFCLSLVIGGIVTVRSTGHAATPYAANRIDAADIPRIPHPPRPGADASYGSLTQDCGRNEKGHYNADNMVTSPGLVGGAHHTHEYVGNVSTDARSTDRSLAAAATTCAGGDLSPYYWPVLRRLDRKGADRHAHGGGSDGNTGEILPPASVKIEFLGNPVAKVVPMPRFLRLVTGDPVAATTNDERVRAQWGCTGRPDRAGRHYPRCPAGSGPTRTLEFPSCWNGLHTDSPDHRAHAVFPAPSGLCPPATFPVPRLRVTLAYRLPHGVPYAIDSFPEQKRHPKTDHAFFVNVMPEQRLARIARCVNEGRRCGPR